MKRCTSSARSVLAGAAGTPPSPCWMKDGGGPHCSPLMRLSLSFVCYYRRRSIKVPLAKCAGGIGPLEVTFKENHFHLDPVDLQS